tara:strand:+ start:391 stop:1353 length:963 start_codon:yes stop_codon:yes gene_type:complete
MADFKVNQITNKEGTQGPIIAGVTTVNSSSAMRIPSGGTGSAYGSGNTEVVRDESLIFHIDVKYSYNALSPSMLYDLSGNNNNSNLYGSPLPTYNSSNGGSLVFTDSNGNYGLTAINGDMLDGGPNGPYTLEFWAYPTTNDDYGSVICTGPDCWNTIGFHAGSSPATNIMYGRNGGGGNQLIYKGGDDNKNKWQHVVQVLNNTDKGPSHTGTLEKSIEYGYSNTRHQSFPGSTETATIHYADLYYNGVLSWIDDIGSSYQFTDPTAFIALCQYANIPTAGQITSGAKFTGRLGVARVYNRALTPAEVLQNYNADKTRFGL